MATAPVTGSTPGLIRTWLLDHEKLIIVVIAAIVIYAGYVKISNVVAAHDAAKLQQAQVVAQQQSNADAALAQQNAALAAQAKQDAADLKALNDKVVAQNQQLANANTALAAALAKQQKTDATLPPNELAQRWAQITPTMPAGGVTLSPDNTMKVTEAAAVATVQQLEQVPTLTTELQNETTQKNSDDQVIAQQGKNIADLSGQVTGLDNQIVGLNKQIVDNNAVCQDQIKVVKDQAAKSKRRWFFIGVAVGFIGRQLIGTKGL